MDGKHLPEPAVFLSPGICKQSPPKQQKVKCYIKYIPAVHGEPLFGA